MAGTEAPERGPSGPWWGYGAALPTAEAEAVVAAVAGVVGPAPRPAGDAGAAPAAAPASRLPVGVRDLLAQLAQVDDSASGRLYHASGSAYPDLVRRRRGELQPLPDAVVAPGDPDQVAAVLRLAARHRLAVVPRGGGTSLVGGVDAAGAGDRTGLVVLDLRGLDAVLDVDVAGRRATFAAGVTLARAAGALSAFGFDLPFQLQTAARATVGGTIASDAVGLGASQPLAEVVRRVHLATTAGGLTAAGSAGGGGPGLAALALGSEGAFGVITEASLLVRPRPAAQAGRALRFGSFADGLAAVRQLQDLPGPPGVAHLYDEALTGLTPRRDGHREPPAGALLVLVTSGAAGAARARLAEALAVCEAFEPVDAGQEVARAWLRSRQVAPARRDVLVAAGYLVDSLPVAAPWALLATLRDALAHAVAEAVRGPVLVGAELIAARPDGGTLWVTAVGPAPAGEELDMWRRVRRALVRTALAGGASIGPLGAHHARFVAGGDVALEGALRALKAELDPAGVLNPGKLLSTPP